MNAFVLTAVALALATSRPDAVATLIGTQVSGALYFEGYPPNYFDPVNGFVPAGYLNTSSSTVTISSSTVEFGYGDSTATITAEFTGSQLIVADLPKFTADYNPLRLVFANSAFTNLAEVSDTFPDGGLTGSLSGSVITLTWGGGNLTSGQPVQAIFNVNVPPALQERVEGLNLGADDYLSKPFYMEELLARIHAVTRRAAGDQLSLMQVGHLTVNLITREVRIGKEKVELTVREFSLLELLMLPRPCFHANADPGACLGLRL